MNRVSYLPVFLLALGSLSAKDPEPAKPPQPRLELPGYLPALAPQGDRVLWVKRLENKNFGYFVSSTKGKALKPKQILEVQSSSDDLLAALTHGGARQWAPDSASFGVVTKGEDRLVRAGIAKLDGSTTWFDDSEDDADVDTHSVCFAPEGGGGWFLEGNSRGRPLGAKIRSFDAEGKPGPAIYEDAERVVLMLEPSPDGTRLAFVQGNQEGLQIAVLDLATKELKTSSSVRTDDHFMSPRLHWTNTSDALILTTRGDTGKFPANVVRCDAATGELKTLVEADRWAVTGVHRDGSVVLFNRFEDTVALLDPTSGKLTPVGWSVLITQQTAQRSVLYAIDNGKAWID